MQPRSTHMDVYSLALLEEEDRLRKQLIDIGYEQVLVLNNYHQLEGLDSKAPNTVVVLLLSESVCNSTNYFLDFQNLKTLPVLALFPKYHRQWCREILNICSEFTVWPCSNQELDIRLRKLTVNFLDTQTLNNSLFVNMNILGNSPQIAEILHKVAKFTQCDAPVFIEGETGTGKEVIARAIHYLGDRREFPFIAVNCGALPDTLIENELFGHQKGAYTDARESQNGIVIQAEGGTLFLDEIETLSRKGQITLLRFLQDMQFRPLGSKSTLTANIRLIAATNESIQGLVENGEFRKDLFYRLNILGIKLPPLRDRGGDILLLAEHFIRQYKDRYRQPEKELHPRTLEGLQRYDWPGNVRELENLLHREFLLADGKYIRIEQFESLTGERRRNCSDRRYRNLFTKTLHTAKSNLIKDFERQYLASTLNRANGNISEAARLAGKERRTFTKLLEKYSIYRRQFKNH